jgi:hypothetical protein
MTYFKASRKLAANSQKAHEDMEQMIDMDPKNQRVPYHRFDVPYKMKQQNQLVRVREHDKPSQKRAKRLGDMKLDEWKLPSRLPRENATRPSVISSQLLKPISQIPMYEIVLRQLPTSWF